MREREIQEHRWNTGSICYLLLILDHKIAVNINLEDYMMGSVALKHVGDSAILNKFVIACGHIRDL